MVSREQLKHRLDTVTRVYEEYLKLPRTDENIKKARELLLRKLELESLLNNE